MAVLYFLPGLRTGSLLDAALVGSGYPWTRSAPMVLTQRQLWPVLRDVTDSDRLAYAELQTGPSGSPGLLLSVRPREDTQAAAALYQPDVQDWHDTEHGYWIGLSGGPPTPQELLLHEYPHTPTHRLRIGPHVWDVPRIRKPVLANRLQFVGNHATELPHQVLLRNGSDVELPPVTRYQHLWDRSRAIFDAFTGAGGDLGWRDLLLFSIDVLQLRYRYPIGLHNVLPEWLDSEAIVSVCKAACGLLLLEDLKKKVPAAM